MKLEMLAKDPESEIEDCQTCYLDEEGMFVVQGPQVGGEDYAALANVLPGEGAVRIKPEILIEAVQRYRSRG